MNPQEVRARFDRPIFIVSMPRSGSTLLFETLAQAPDLYTIGGESHRFIEGLAPFTPIAHDWDSNRLTEADANHPAVTLLTDAFYNFLKDRDGNQADGRVRMLEKTPKNSLRVPFLDAIWRDGLFVYLYRDPHQGLASMMRAWQSGKFKTYSQLPGWTGLPWSLVLVPGWRELIGAPLPQIVAHQWTTATNVLLDDLEQRPAGRVVGLDYDVLIADPQRAMEALAPQLDLAWDRPLTRQLPPSKMTLTAPKADKWRELESEIVSVWPIIADADLRARNFLRSLRN
jgi:hypothetical protein